MKLDFCVIDCTCVNLINLLSWKEMKTEIVMYL